MATFFAAEECHNNPFYTFRLMALLYKYDLHGQRKVKYITFSKIGKQIFKPSRNEKMGFLRTIHEYQNMQCDLLPVQLIVSARALFYWEKSCENSSLITFGNTFISRPCLCDYGKFLIKRY